MTDPTLFQRSAEPLAARMRPRTLVDFLGQEHILGPGKALGELIRRGDVGSCLFWGPPGSGKTTLALLIANYTKRHFEPFSAATEGVGRVREIIAQAEERLQYEGRGTILFCDEIHRFNRAQQDAFLPWVENGVVTLIGATTENPSFELTGALLSRCRVFVLEPLRPDHIMMLVRRALEDREHGLGNMGLHIDEDALAMLARESDGEWDAPPAPAWESLLVRIVRAIGRNDAAGVRQLLPAFITPFSAEPPGPGRTASPAEAVPEALLDGAPRKVAARRANGTAFTAEVIVTRVDAEDDPEAAARIDRVAERSATPLGDARDSELLCRGEARICGRPRIRRQSRRPRWSGASDRAEPRPLAAALRRRPGCRRPTDLDQHANGDGDWHHGGRFPRHGRGPGPRILDPVFDDRRRSRPPGTGQGEPAALLADGCRQTAPRRGRAGGARRARRHRQEIERDVCRR